MRVEEVRKMHLKMKVQKRIEASRIVGVIGFRDHFSSHPERHSWDLCGHPVYWWVLKLASETNYLKKILLWTEVEEAWKDAKEMSDKFIIMKRTIEECREPTWEFIDDLKIAKSRRATQKWSLYREEEVNKLLGFEPTAQIVFGANKPFVRTKSVNRMIERYFEDDITEQTKMVTKNHHLFCYLKDPNYPEYIIPIFEFSCFNRRQERPEAYIDCGAGILNYYDIDTSNRITYIEVGRDECVDIHDEEDLELAKFYMEKRLKEKGCNNK